MIITFCGHSQIFNRNGLTEKLLETIKTEANNQPATFYLGDYGQFDGIAKHCAIEYKKQYPQSEVVFVTPYLDDTYLKNREPLKYGYDRVIYPDIEKNTKTICNSWKK